VCVEKKPVVQLNIIQKRNLILKKEMKLKQY